MLKKTSKLVYSVVASVAIILFWINAGSVKSWLGIVPQSVVGMTTTSLLLALVAIVLSAVAVGLRRVPAFLGIDGNVLKGLGVALLSVLPLCAIFMLMGSLDTELTFAEMLRKCILAAFNEELVFRAFMFGLLFRYVKTGFFWALLFPALLFASFHLYQGNDLLSSLAAFGVTFIGAVYFSWMYVEWDFNLWVPIGLHMLMNAAWSLFVVDGTDVAAGGVVSNVARIASIALAVGLTVWHRRKQGRRVFDYQL